MKYIHPFIYSLCTIIPLPPEDPLRKGTGTLYASLLMIAAFKHHIIAPNNTHSESFKRFCWCYIAQETYIGGHVECLCSGLYREDLPLDFSVQHWVIDNLLFIVYSHLAFTCSAEIIDSADVLTLEHTVQKICTQLSALLPPTAKNSHSYSSGWCKYNTQCQIKRMQFNTTDEHWKRWHRREKRFILFFFCFCFFFFTF